MADGEMRVDVGRVRETITFYRGFAAVSGSVSTDLATHEFAAWGTGADALLLRERFSAMARRMSENLRTDGSDAESLADDLDRGLSLIEGTDARIALSWPTP
ncbi:MULTISPECIES: hypothetical protein [Gordonia]|jgi:hypothetical protein|uniref:Uncharacterized protein n=1 Tax=Gordonia pseudamarae TaxID=2831662 RepID=A0ABX6IFL5_9ACTN|nr:MULTISPECIES: hypothetical protein [Gordonia]MBD0020444.1 hypothetical protein [Gordonia sp. (in: high G+C Gram-positive bacteria)]QHN34636.1 hypothetical protein GII31_06715 [Gordonia pseudamarae]